MISFAINEDTFAIIGDDKSISVYTRTEFPVYYIHRDKRNTEFDAEFDNCPLRGGHTCYVDSMSSGKFNNEAEIWERLISRMEI